MNKVSAHVCLVAGIAAAALVLSNGFQNQDKLSSENQENASSKHAQIPIKLRTLIDLQLLGQQFTRMERLEWLVRWYVEESLSPTPSSTGIGGGPIDSGYIKQQLIRSFAGGGDARALKWLDESRALRHPNLALAVKLALGIRGDLLQRDVLMATLAHDKDPNHRMLAAFGLAVLATPEARAVLKKALEDPFYVNFVGSDDPKTRTFPVRTMAKSALNILENEGLLDYQATLRAKLVTELEDYDDFVSKEIATLRRIAEIGNRLATNAGR